jgi:hypothetical protein
MYYVLYTRNLFWDPDPQSAWPWGGGGDFRQKEVVTRVMTH